ncbi:MAG: tetratricopeptide repeat protein [Planctomycetota bacterium]
MPPAAPRPRTRNAARPVAGALSLLAALPLAGCGSTLYEAQAAFKAGNANAAENLIADYARANKRSEHRVIAHFELGSIMFEAGRYADSARAFQYAEDQLLELERNPPSSFTEQLESTFKNPAEVTYRGTPYERVMSATMLGLAYCMLGDFESARPSFRSADFWQDDGIRQRQEQINGARRELDESRAPLAAGVESAARSYEDSFFTGYESVSNSFADVVQGAFLLGQLEGSSDATDAAFFFGRASGIYPSNTFAARDAALADQVGSTPPNRTYVLFATGFAPFLMELTIALPLPGIGIATAAFPILTIDQSGYTRTLTIEADSELYEPEPIADMDRIVGADFNAELPAITAKHTAAILARNSIAVGTRVAAREVEGPAGALLALSGLFYNIWQNKADLRSWRTLPKYYAYASFETPASGIITIDAPPLGPESVEVSPTGVNIVYVRALRPNLPVTIAAFNVGTESVRTEPDEPTQPASSLQEEPTP